MENIMTETWEIIELTPEAEAELSNGKGEDDGV